MALSKAQTASGSHDIATPLPLLQGYWDYATDCWQRNVLFLDVMRQRGEQYREHAAATVPHVLDYDAELVCDGRTLPRPVNYLLVKIVPPQGVFVDPMKRPFVIIDPRAGHGPGIAGFKADSEIGVALQAGHPSYFVGFLPEPVPGQTIEDIVEAQAKFLELVIARHPEAEAKPCVIGNCQAGWSVMMVASLRPELFGPIIAAGTPLSYWGGVRGRYPMRYAGGLLGGSWLTALTGDLGAGIFDGAWLVQNFENQNPANTLWSKHYNLYSKVDTEADRYLGFEKWWGGHVTLNAEEMQFIVDELFVGNKLAAADIRTRDGTAIDMRNIRSPIVVFCSQGDNITPPQQALGWILDLYDSVDEIRTHGQTIVYTIHDRVGHLGIFVSGGVARKEHTEFSSNIDFLDVLPPGLYEVVLEPKDDGVANPDLATGDWVMRCENRTLDDIRALGGNDLEDERRFAVAAKASEINLALYRTFMQPAVRAAVTPTLAEAFRRFHPLRIQYEMFGNGTLLGKWVEQSARQIRAERKSASSDNPFLAWQDHVSRQIIDGLDAWRDGVERLSEQTFHAIYGNPVLQTALGIDQQSEHPLRKPAKSLLHQALVEARIEELRAQFEKGGLLEATVRGLAYVGMGRHSADERGFGAIRRLRRQNPDAQKPTLPDFKAAVRTQFFMLLIDEEAALAAIPSLLPNDEELRQNALISLRQVLEARGELSKADRERLARIELLFDLSEAPTAVYELSNGQVKLKAS